MIPNVSFSDDGVSQNLPPRSHSLANVGKAKSDDPIRESTQDVDRARHILNKHIVNNSLHEERKNDQKGEKCLEELLQSFTQMIEWVEKLASLLQKAYDSQLESETALMLAESNLQMALANNEMLEDALKQAGPNVRDVGWMRLSERERLRQVTRGEEESETPYEDSSSPIHKPQSPPPSSQTHTAPPHHQPSSSLRFFTFPSLARSTPTISGHSSQSPGRAESPTGTHPITHPHPHSRPSSPALSRPTPREKELATLLEKEKEALKSVAEAKLALENELETLSQALFEEANKMVANSNRKLAETEEELRVVMEEREALRGALRIVEGENGMLREKNVGQGILADEHLQPDAEVNGESITHHAVSANYLRLEESSSLADRISFIAISPVDSEIHDSAWNSDASIDSNATKSCPTSDSSPRKESARLRPLDPHTDLPNPRSEISTGTSPLSPLHSKPTIRWSVMPQTPRSRLAVKNEFEKAMSRMKRLIEDVEGISHLTPTENHEEA